MPGRTCSALILTALSVAPAPAQEAYKPIAQLAEITAHTLPWGTCKKAPEWLDNCPKVPGMFSLSTVRRGSNSALAQTRAERFCGKDVRAVLRDHLQPVVAEQHLKKVLAALLAKTQLAEAVVEPTRRIPGARGPGQTVGAAYMRWQIPVREAIATLPPELQGRVEWLLLRDVVPWQSVAAPPAWLEKPPHEPNRFRCVIVTEGSFPNDAQEQTQSKARERITAKLTAQLERTGLAVEPIVARGLQRVAPVRRAYWFRSAPPLKGSKRTRRLTTTYVLWEIPTAALTRGMRAIDRDKVLKTLRDQQR